MSQLLEALPESCRPHLKFISDGHIFQYDKITMWRDRRFEPVFPARTIKYAYENHQPLEKDVLIAGFKKSGTSWTKERVREILYGRDPEFNAISKDVDFPISFLETGEPSKYEVIHNLPLPRRFHTTHLPPEVLNMDRYKKKNMKIIFLLRNPKDQLVSFFHHLQSIPMSGDLKPYSGLGWNDFFQQEIRGKFPHGLREGETFFDYLLSWWPHVKDNPNALIMVYEENIRDPVGQVNKLAKFLEVDITDEVAEEIAIKCSLDSMKQEAAKGSSEKDIFLRTFGNLRKGIVGKWKDYFTVAQSEIIDKMVEEKLGGTGIEFIYE